jgi:hypothetical protein
MKTRKNTKKPHISAFVIKALFLALFLTYFLPKTASASVMSIAYDETRGTLTTTQKDRLEKIRSLMDWMLISNNASGSEAVLQIVIRPKPIDGTNMVLAQSLGGPWVGNGQTPRKYVASGNRIIEVDTADSPSWTTEVFGEVIFHEIGHSLGWDDTIWKYNGLLDVHGRYVGQNALAAYRQEYDSGATFVPMDLEHPGHIMESVNRKSAMTPMYDSGYYVDRVTLGVMEDNGWTVNHDFKASLLADLLPSEPDMNVGSTMANAMSGDVNIWLNDK